MVESIQRDGVCSEVISPAPDLAAALVKDATRIGEIVATKLEVVGVLAVEMFVGKDGRLLVNELAPRPHNSGHWTIDACAVSQFEQVVRAITGLPLGAPDRFADAEMDNLLGEAAENWLELVRRPGARLHLYGKTPIRPGRKHGHITTLRLPGAR